MKSSAVYQVAWSDSALPEVVRAMTPVHARLSDAPAWLALGSEVARLELRLMGRHLSPALLEVAEWTDPEQIAAELAEALGMPATIGGVVGQAHDATTVASEAGVLHLVAGACPGKAVLDVSWFVLGRQGFVALLAKVGPHPRVLAVPALEAAQAVLMLRGAVARDPRDVLLRLGDCGSSHYTAHCRMLDRRSVGSMLGVEETRRRRLGSALGLMSAQLVPDLFALADCKQPAAVISLAGSEVGRQ